MIVKENEKQVSVHFNSILDLMDFTPPRNNYDSFNRLINDHLATNNALRGFIGDTEYYGEIIKRALLGDSKMLQEARKIEHEFEFENGKAKTSSQVIRKAKRKHVQGGMGEELDIHSVYQGRSGTAWRKMIRVEEDSIHSLITIFVSIGGGWKIKVSETIVRCALILKITEELQSAGKSVQIIVGGGYYGAMRRTCKKLTTSIIVKKYNETLTPERLAAMTNIGFHRVFSFAAQDSQERSVEKDRGTTLSIDNYFMPIHLEEEIELGHTKPIFIRAFEDINSGRRELISFYSQMSNS